MFTAAVSSQNRFVTPQRVQNQNVQRQSFGCDGHCHCGEEGKKNGTTFAGGIAAFLVGATAIVGIPLFTYAVRNQGVEARDKQLAPLIDSLSGHKINAGNLDAVVQKRALAQQAADLLKEANKVKVK